MEKEMDWKSFMARVCEGLLAEDKISPEFRAYLIAKLASRKGSVPPIESLMPYP